MFSFFLGAADLVTSVSHFASRSPPHASHAFAAQLLGDSLKILLRSILPAFSRRSLGRHLRWFSISGAAANTTFRTFGVLPVFSIFVISNTTKQSKKKVFPQKITFFQFFSHQYSYFFHFCDYCNSRK